MKIYIDDEFCCHTVNLDGVYTEAETGFFDGKCADFIEGYRFVPAGASWTREDDVVFTGEMIAPWKPYGELDIAQRAYEQEQYAILLAEKHSYTEAYNRGVNEA